MNQLIDLTEIPQANTGAPASDSFELFARDFLEALGFRIVEGPGRGADGGRDLLVEELTRGIVAETRITWVVSAKHHAHSGRSVSDADEPDPMGRVHKFNATGFMGFYSTLLSSGLDGTLSSLRERINVHVFDRGRICTTLISTPALASVFSNYLPGSYAQVARLKRPDTRLRIQKDSFPRPGPIPLTCKSMQEYICEHQLIRHLDERAATAANVAADFHPEDNLALPLNEEASYFGITTVAHLHDVVKELAEVALKVGQCLQPEVVRHGYSIGLVMKVMAAQLGGIEEYMQHVQTLKHTETARGFAQEVINAYNAVVSEYA